MKKTLNHIFDEANANEIDNLVKQNAVSEVSADTLSSIKDKVYTKTNLKKEIKTPKSVWLRFGAIAACFCLIVGVVFATGILNFSDDVPGDQHNDGKKKEVLSLNELHGRTDFDSIVWGDDVNLNPDQDNTDIDPVVPGDGDNNSLLYDGAWTEWNGIKITKQLYGGISKLDANTVIAIVAKSLNTTASSLNNYEYNGKTYAQLLNELSEAEDMYYKLVMIKDFADYYLTNYDRLFKDDHEAEQFWQKVYFNVDKDFLHENNYVVDGEDPFNDEVITNDLNRYEVLRKQLENDINLCRIEYRVKNAPNIDWSKFAEKGFDVYQNEGPYIVVISIHSMESFADCVKEVCSAELVSNTVFRYATHAELGLPTPDIPSDDGQDIVPGGVNDEPIEIPHDEQPVQDDVAVE